MTLPFAYFDHCATTPLRSEVLEVMLPWMTGLCANASSPYTAGGDARRAIEAARKEAAEVLGCLPEEIFFTSGGTESDNTALRGTAAALSPGPEHCLVTSAMEHPAVYRTAHALEKEGFALQLLPPDAEGGIAPEQLAAALSPEVFLVSLMAVNNEIGTVYDTDAFGRLCHERGVLFHSDMVQAPGMLPLRLENVDLASFSAHKFGGPKGTGLLFCRKGTPIVPLLTGGGQESGLRSGTENTAGIIGCVRALRLAAEEQPENAARARALQKSCREALARLPDVHFHGPQNGGAPHILSVGFAGTQAEGLLHSLDLAGFCVSAGSACSGLSSRPSRILQAIGVEEYDLHSTLRLSFGRENTPEQICRFTETLEKILPLLRGQR